MERSIVQTLAATPADQATTGYWLAGVLVAVGIALVAFALYTWWRRRSEAPTEADEALMAGTAKEAERLLRVMGEAEELAARLEQRFDEQSRRMESLLARAERITAAAPIGPAAPRVEPAPPRNPAPAPEIVTRPAPVAVAATAHSSAARTRAQPAAPPAAGGLGHLTEQVYQLADAGTAPAEIAKRLGQEAVTIDLILAMRGA